MRGLLDKSCNARAEKRTKISARGMRSPRRPNFTVWDDDEYDQLVDDQSETINIDTLLQRIRHWRTLESSRDHDDGQS